jgi:putative ABC transport system permease protein
MFLHYLKITVRNIFKRKGVTFINIFGLCVGMACAVLIFLWVGHQLSYDDWQVNKDRIYRLEENGGWVIQPPYIRDTAVVFPEVEQAIRFYFWYEPTVKYGENVFAVKDFALVDDEVFEVFNFNFTAGLPDEALKNPNSLILTDSIAKRLFGDADPLGKTVSLDNRYDYTVTGVIEDIKKFHMKIDAFASVHDMTRRAGNSEFLTSRNYNFPVYLMLSPQTNIADLEDKIFRRAEEVNKRTGPPFLLRPFKDIYFAKNLIHENNVVHGNFTLVLFFSIVAVLILVIACINFINLTIAKTGTREKEIAVRKVAGAPQRSLQLQFFGETFVVVLISFSLAIILVVFSLPYFSSLTGEVITADALDAGKIPILAGILLFTAFISGFYPAFYLSSLQPVWIMKGKSGKGRKNSVLSKLLIAFQFTISIFLIISAITVVRQLSYMQNRDLGINHDQVLTCFMRGDRFRGNAKKLLNSKISFKQRLLSHPSIQGVTYLSQLPGGIKNTWSWTVPGREDSVPVRVLNSDPDFIDLLGAKIIQGRNFSFENQADRSLRFIINETAVKELGLKDPFTDPIDNGRMKVIGVVEDFHYNSLHNQIGPMAIRWAYWSRRACIKISGRNIKDSVSHIERIYREFCPGFAFEYDFLDETFAAQYKAEQKLGGLLTNFVLLAVCISCLGLFGLTAFVAERKTKEIGIRKVLGSTNTGIVVLLSKTFLKWILLANLAAWPVAYFVLQRWLQGFAYRIDIPVIVFILSAALALTIALLTIAYQAIKAASANPVESLRYE